MNICYPLVLEIYFEFTQNNCTMEQLPKAATRAAWRVLHFFQEGKKSVDIGQALRYYGKIIPIW